MQFVSNVLDFIEQGGTVIWAIFFACLLLWTAIVERLWFLRVTYPKQRKKIIEEWKQRADHSSWRARRIREATISEQKMSLHARLRMIQTLILLCPLLGLLGTVTGMVGVFEVIAISGNSDAQNMAKGIYRATIPTMAGLVVALSGYYLAARIKQLADRQSAKLADRLMLL